MTSVAIIGVGNVGEAIATPLLIQGAIDELLLVDTRESFVEGVAMDMRHSMARLPKEVAIRVVKIHEIASADIVVITAGARRNPHETRLALISRNAGLVTGLVKKVVQANPTCTLLMVSNPVDVMTYVAWSVSGFPRERVVGTGTLLDSMRMQYLCAQYLTVPIQNIDIKVLGEHGNACVPLWSAAVVQRKPLLLADNDKAMLHHALITASKEILKTKGYTDFAVGIATADIIVALLGNVPSNPIPVSCILEGEYGLDDVALSVPAVLGHGKLLAIQQPIISDDESKALHETAEILKEKIREITL